jgi:hypothetical protein
LYRIRIRLEKHTLKKNALAVEDEIGQVRKFQNVKCYGLFLSKIVRIYLDKDIERALDGKEHSNV